MKSRKTKKSPRILGGFLALLLALGLQATAFAQNAPEINDSSASSAAQEIISDELNSDLSQEGQNAEQEQDVHEDDNSTGSSSALHEDETLEQKENVGIDNSEADESEPEEAAQQDAENLEEIELFITNELNLEGVSAIIIDENQKLHLNEYEEGKGYTVKSNTVLRSNGDLTITLNNKSTFYLLGIELSQGTLVINGTGTLLSEVYAPLGWNWGDDDVDCYGIIADNIIVESGVVIGYSINKSDGKSNGIFARNTIIVKENAALIANSYGSGMMPDPAHKAAIVATTLEVQGGEVSHYETGVGLFVATLNISEGGLAEIGQIYAETIRVTGKNSKLLLNQEFKSFFMGMHTVHLFVEDYGTVEAYGAHSISAEFITATNNGTITGISEESEMTRVVIDVGFLEVSSGATVTGIVLDDGDEFTYAVGISIVDGRIENGGKVVGKGIGAYNIGIALHGEVLVDGGTVIGQAAGSNSTGLFINRIRNSDSLTVTNNGQLTATTDKKPFSVGFKGDNADVYVQSGGEIIAEGMSGMVLNSGEDFGSEPDDPTFGNLFVDKGTVRVSGQGAGVGLQVENRIEVVNNGAINATAVDNHGIYVTSGDMDVIGGEIKAHSENQTGLYAAKGAINAAENARIDATSTNGTGIYAYNGVSAKSRSNILGTSEKQTGIVVEKGTMLAQAATIVGKGDGSQANEFSGILQKSRYNEEGALNKIQALEGGLIIGEAYYYGIYTHGTVEAGKMSRIQGFAQNLFTNDEGVPSASILSDVGADVQTIAAEVGGSSGVIEEIYSLITIELNDKQPKKPYAQEFPGHNMSDFGNYSWLVQDENSEDFILQDAQGILGIGKKDNATLVASRSYASGVDEVIHLAVGGKHQIHMPANIDGEKPPAPPSSSSGSPESSSSSASNAADSGSSSSLSRGSSSGSSSASRSSASEQSSSAASSVAQGSSSGQVSSFVEDSPSQVSTGPEPDENTASSANLSTITLGENGIPLFGEGAVWGMLNLILAVFGFIGSGFMLVHFFVQRNNSKNEPSESKRKQSLLWRVAGILIGVIAAVVFMLTENMKNHMVFADSWTAFMLVLTVLQLLSVLLMRKSSYRAPKEEI